jgi:uncharacterized protein (TIGR03435 family)
MALGLWKRIGFAAFFLAAGLGAQGPRAEPRFEVVSIRVVPKDAPPVMFGANFDPVLPGGQYVSPRTLLPFMISLAYNVENPANQLVGLPKWAQEQSFEVAAKPGKDFPALPPGENLEQVRLMMRAMLADRFHLQLHTETRQEQVYHLEVAKGGIKIKEVDPPVPPAKAGLIGAAMGDDSGRLIGNKSTMEGLAGNLTMWMKHPVIDQTGLKGYYDFDVKWSADAKARDSGFGSEGTALLISALQNQFGLRLTNANGPVKYWVVDHVEMPTEN